MPELPEIQTVTDSLRKNLLQEEVADFFLYWAKTLSCPSLEEFCKNIVGKKLLQVRRRGKFAILKFGKGKSYYFVVFHLRMTGQLLIRKKEDQSEKYLVARFIFLSGKELRFNNMRKFGRLWGFYEREISCFKGLQKLGPEPLQDDFSLTYFQSELKKTNRNIKSFLLDQTKIAGLGNIYVNEALFQAGIDPVRSSKTLKKKEVKKLYHAIRDVLRRAIVCRGTSLSDYFTPEGEKGSFQTKLKVHSRRDEKCFCCEEKIEYKKVSQRGTYYCPNCQK